MARRRKIGRHANGDLCLFLPLLTMAALTLISGKPCYPPYALPKFYGWMGFEKLRGAPLCLLVVSTLKLISGLGYSRQIYGVDHVTHADTHTADRVRFSGKPLHFAILLPSRRSTFLRLLPAFFTAVTALFERQPWM